MSLRHLDDYKEDDTTQGYKEPIGARVPYSEICEPLLFRVRVGSGSKTSMFLSRL